MPEFNQRRMFLQHTLAAGAWWAGGGVMADNPPDAKRPFVGAYGQVGCWENPRRQQRLQISRPGVYENYLIDGEWIASNLVKINANDVTLRNCEIRHSRHNAVTVYARDVLIENCKIHHLLNGTFSNQLDAHGITGQPTNLTIRNCEIYYTSGDSLQFDPGRRPWDNVVVEHCTLWTGPLPADAADFRQGERPGENAIDTKQSADNPRSRLVMRNCLMYGWGGDGQISNQAALNLKDHVAAEIVDCVVADSDIAFRLRGDARGGRGGAEVTVRNCAVYNTQTALRIENAPHNLQVLGLGIGAGVVRKQQVVSGRPANMIYRDEFVPPAYEQAIRDGWA